MTRRREGGGRVGDQGMGQSAAFTAESRRADRYGRGLRVLAIAFIVASVVAVNLLRDANDRADRAESRASALRQSAEADIPALLFQARRPIIDAAVQAEGAWRLAAEKMVADAYEEGFNYAIDCQSAGSVQACQERFAYLSIPTYPNDFGYSGSVAYPKSAISSSRDLQATVCGEGWVSFNLAPVVGLESFSWFGGEWSKKLDWLLRAACKRYGAAVGGLLSGYPANIWDGPKLVKGAIDREIPSWLFETSS